MAVIRFSVKVSVASSDLIFQINGWEIQSQTSSVESRKLPHQPYKHRQHRHQQGIPSIPRGENRGLLVGGHGAKVGVQIVLSYV